MPRPIRATIDLDALRRNHALARRQAGGARVWSVVKANAYGHGLLRVARALADATDGFAVLDFAEARALREAGIGLPLLMLEGFFAPEDIDAAAELGLTCVLHSEAQLRRLEAAHPGAPLAIYLKLNTGMNRLGFAPADFPAVLAKLRTLPQVAGITLMTHFADADGASGIAAQLAEFERLRAGSALPVSIANSAALLRFPQARGDWVRPGIMLYGGSPFAPSPSAAELGLAPVMHLESELIAVQRLAPGERVGYGGLFEAPAPMRAGIVACGYADGYPRHAPTGTPVLVGGRRTRLLGRVSMDMLAVDLTGLDAAQVGTPVTLWGEGLAADEVAHAAGTLSYELFCALAARVPAAAA